MKITERPATALPKMTIHRKVAAYCRVSTQQEIQHHSLDAQRTYYEKLITSNPGWEFVGIYADEASGRHNAKMRDFQRMMGDCRTGKIDLILVKSISRLGRNTLQFLQVCVELKQLGVDVYFEVEKIYLHNPKAVRLLTVYASVYQNESEMKSANTRWGIRSRFANGTSAIANTPCYGYRRNEEGQLELIVGEAEVVRLIHACSHQGMSLRKIARELDVRSIPSPKGKSGWSIETIRWILQNEKYYGHVLLQKTYVSDYFTGRRALNSFTISKRRGQRNCINYHHFYVGVQSLEWLEKFEHHTENVKNSAKLHEKIRRWDAKNCVPRCGPSGETRTRGILVPNN